METTGKINIGGALHSIATNHTVVYTGDIYDSNIGKYQSEINEYLIELVNKEEDPIDPPTPPKPDDPVDPQDPVEQQPTSIKFLTYSEMISSDKLYNGLITCVTNDSDESKNGIYWVSGNDETKQYIFKKPTGELSYTLLHINQWLELLDNNLVDSKVLYFIYEDDYEDEPTNPDNPPSNIQVTIEGNTVVFTNATVELNTLVLSNETIDSGNLIIS